MTDEQWEQLDEKMLSTIQLCLAPHVLHEVLDKPTVVIFCKHTVYHCTNYGYRLQRLINLKFDPFSTPILPLFSYNLSANLSKKAVVYTFLTYYALICPIS